MAKKQYPTEFTLQTMKRQGTCLVRLTPPGTGAVATLLLDGPEAKSIINQRISPKLSITEQTNGVQIPNYAKFYLDTTNSKEEKCHEKVVIFEKNSNQIEIHSHGGEIVLDVLENELISLGVGKMTPELWEQQRKTCPVVQKTCSNIQNEAMFHLIQAETEFASKILLTQYLGKLTDEIQTILHEICEHRIENAGNRLEILLNRATVHLTTPLRIAIVGPVNAGKSSLFNAILGFGRSIVSPTPGTTRDLVSFKTAIHGWPVLLIDTAGMRETSDPLETLGVKRSESMTMEADCLLHVIDVTSVTDVRETESLIRTATCFRKPTIHVLNKIDLLKEGGQGVLQVAGKQTFYVSAETGEGIEALLHGMMTCLIPNPPKIGEAVPFTQNQTDVLQKAKASLDRGDSPSVVMLLEVMLLKNGFN